MTQKLVAPLNLRWFVRGDLDGFFGLFIYNLMQLMLITVLCQSACGFPMSFIVGRILPGAAISILLGNLFYAWQARQLALKTGQRHVTALPFGINTVSLLAFIFLVMAPVYYETGDTDLAWRTGLAACFLSGVIETSGAFIGDWLRRHTPRAALLSGLAGVALSFMTLGFSFQIFAAPSIALLPMMLIFISYGSRVKLPLRLPGGLVAIVVGIGTAWILKAMGISQISVSTDPIALSFNLPTPSINEVFSPLFHSTGWTSIAIVAPIGLFNVIGSIQNLESAEAAGDRYETKPALLVNGLTSLLASFLGSPFPTAIYLGHPGWKAMGARSGYSVLNGAVIAILCLMGGISVILRFVPIEVTLGMLIWIGVVIVGQAFQETNRRHAIAVALGLIPSLAAWALHLIETSLRIVGSNLYDVAAQFGAELYIDGIISLYQGFLLIAMIFSAIMTYVIDHKYLHAAVWSFAASVLSAIGLIHAYQLTPSGIQSSFGFLAAPTYALLYAIMGVLFLGLHYKKNTYFRDLEP